MTKRRDPFGFAGQCTFEVSQVVDVEVMGFEEAINDTDRGSRHRLEQINKFCTIQKFVCSSPDVVEIVIQIDKGPVPRFGSLVDDSSLGRLIYFSCLEEVVRKSARAQDPLVDEAQHLLYIFA